MDPFRVRIRFSKQGDLRFTSHRDLVRTLERLFRRAGVEVALSEGFHPKPRFSFPAPLALGIAGVDEVLEVDLAKPMEPAALLDTLSITAPPGLAFHAAAVVPPQTRKAQAASGRFEMALPSARLPDTRAKIAQFLSATTWPIQRPDREQAVDVRPWVDELAVEEDSTGLGMLRMRLRANDEAGARPRDLLALLGLADLVEAGHFLTRTQVELKGQSAAATAAGPREFQSDNADLESKQT